MSPSPDAVPQRMHDCLDELLRGVGMPALARGEERLTGWARLRAALAARNLGLVRVREPRSFAWPGYWIAAVRSGADSDAAVLMYGAPSARVWPRDAPGEIVDGFVLAPFDPSLDPRDPYATLGATAAGVVAGLFTSPQAGAPMLARHRVRVLPGVGLEGDRYAVGAGTFSGPTGHEVTLIESEALARLEPPLPWALARRNIVTSGLDLNTLVGHRFLVGGATLVGRRLCEPCRHLEQLAQRPLVRPLVHRGGLRADVLAGGVVEIGSPVVTG